MKNLVLLIGLLFATNAFAQGFICNGGYGFDGAGNVMSGTNNKCYVKVVSSVDMVDGDVAILNVISDGGYGVTLTASEAVSAYCVMDETCGSGNVCKCQVYGHHDAVKTNVAGKAISAGYGLTTGQSNGCAQGVTQGYQAFAIALDNASTSGTVEAFINAM